jgi:hypothetical protein
MTRTGSTGCSAAFALFGIPFAAAGIGMTVFLYLAVFRWVEMRDWKETPATIESIKVSRTDTTGTEATFRYEWDGEPYTGDWVSIHPGQDNVGDFQERIADELTRHHDTGKPFRCFVNPHAPAEAILYRELRWPILSFLAIFGTIFTTVGCGIVIASASSIPLSRKEARLKAEFVDQPWRWKPDWADKVIRGEEAPRWVAVIAVWWIFVTTPGGLGAVHAISQGNLRGIFGLILPGCSLLILRSAVRSSLHRRRFGESRLRLNRFPAITGGTMAGEVLVEKELPRHAIWKLTLTCETRQQKGDDEKHSKAFSETVSVEMADSSSSWGSSAIPFEFEIPYNSPQSDTDGPVFVEWELDVAGTGGEVAYSNNFLIPVFETEESTPEVVSRGPDTATDFPTSADDALIRARLLIQDHINGSVTVVAPARRYLSSIISLAIFCLIWDSITVLLFLQNGPFFFRLAFGGVAVAITWALVDLLLRSARFHLDSDSLTFRNGWPLTSRERRLLLSDIQKVSTKPGMTSNGTQYFTVTVSLRTGKPLTIISMIRGEEAADTIVGRIREALKES